MRRAVATVGVAGPPPSARPRARLARRLLTTGATLATSVLLLAGCMLTPGQVGAPGPTPADLVEQVSAAESQPTTTAPADLAQTALDVLDGLEIARKTEWDGYFDRVGSFGEGWGDPDGNGCDARNDALRQAFTNVQLLRDGCRVDTGTFLDPYTGETIEFQRGAASSDDVQVDHVVALYNAWRTGAQELTMEQRIAFSNDPLNLQPTLDWVNDDKGSSDASQWLPPNEAYHCTYVSRQIAVKATYGLWVTQTEHDAMRDVLRGCAGKG